MKELKLKKCKKCGSLVKVLEEGSGNYICCGEPMEEVKANSVDASFEKHVPTYEKVEDNIHIKVNRVMDEDHYIEWILVQTEKGVREFFLKPGDEAQVIMPYEPATVYAYCNLHGLWKNTVE